MANAGRRRPDAAIRRPEMPQQESDLHGGQLKCIARNALLVASLPEDAETPEPSIDATRPTTVSVATEKELMPASRTTVPTHGGSERRVRSVRDRSAIVLGT